MRPTTSFIGREDAEARLVALVSAARCVTVTGPGGVGKTRLARETAKAIARDLTEDLRFVDLAVLPPDAGAPAIAAEVGFESPEAAAVALAQRSTLLVLDNCEHLLDGAAEFVARVLDSDVDVRVLATSREPLAIEGEHVFVLAPLALPTGDVDIEAAPAVRLFLDRATSSGAQVDRSPRALAAVADLCRRLDGLPLAIELAAARARTASPVELLADVDHRLDLLRRRTRSGAPRHDSMRTAIAASIELLDDQDRRAFLRLGVFAGPFTADTAHRVLGAESGDRLRTLDLLARLVDRSLVVAEPATIGTRYRMLELLREYALEQLREANESTAVQERFVDALAAEADQIVADALGGWSPALLDRAGLQFHNFVAGIEWCVRHDDGPARCYRLVLPLFTAVHQSRSGEVVEIGSRVLDRWPDTPAPCHAEALAVLATAAVISGDVDLAMRLGERSLADRRGTIVATIVAERALGLATRATHQFAEAREHFARGHAAAAEARAGSFARELAGFEASVRDMQGDGAGAIVDLEQLLADAVGASDAINETWVRLVLSTALMRAQRWDDAERELERATAAAAALDYPWWDGARLRQLAVLTATRGSLVATTAGWAASRPIWLDAIEQAASRGSTGEVALTMRAAAVVAAKAGAHDAADALLAAAPRSRELTVLPALFPDDVPAPAADASSSAPALVDSLRAAREILDVSRPADAPADAAAAVNTFARDGDTWALTFRGQTARLRHLKGLADLAVLLRQPDHDVHCLELVGAAVADGGLGPALDDRARRAYEARIRELQAEIDEARDANDLGRVERAEAELDALVDQLAGAFGLHGRSRPVGSGVERARTAVTYRIRAALRRVREHHAALGHHLEHAVKTGTWCAYRPEVPTEWHVRAG